MCLTNVQLRTGRPVGSVLGHNRGLRQAAFRVRKCVGARWKQMMVMTVMETREAMSWESGLATVEVRMSPRVMEIKTKTNGI